MIYEADITNDGEHVGWITAYDVTTMNTIELILEDAGYDVDWSDNECQEE